MLLLDDFQRARAFSIDLIVLGADAPFLASIFRVSYRLYEAASLRQVLSFQFPDTHVLQLSEACLTTLFALLPGDSSVTAHDGVR